MNAEILTIGDEVLRGEIVDSNKSFLSERLRLIDVECHYQASVRDHIADMTAAFRLAVSRSDVVLVSGGLGPTRDDLTAAVLAEAFGRGMQLDEASLEQIREFFARIGRPMADNNAKQAHFPEGAEVLANPIGTAPGFMLEEQGALVFCLPGVPRELMKMMDEQVAPRLVERGSMRGGAQIVRAELLRTFGTGESTLDAELVDLARGEGVELGFRTAFPDNYLRPVARAKTVAEAEAKLSELVRAICDRLGPVVYGTGEESLEVVVGQLLTEQNKTIAVAESCTGGLLAQRLTAVSGASSYFLGGVVAYANSAKTDLLGVPEDLLEAHGAVSDPVATAMAEGARTRFGADFGVATTGISGPTGGTDEKPVGLVHVAISWPEGSRTEGFVFPVDRERHRVLTVQLCLDWVRRALQGHELSGPTLMRQKGNTPPPTTTGAGL